VQRIVIEAGFRYARTVENLHVDVGNDPYAVPTTVQFYPHPRRVLSRNFARYGHYAARWRAMVAAAAATDWRERLRRMLGLVLEQRGVLHLWGHSWEVEERGLWTELEAFFALVSSRDFTAMTISDVVSSR
jgi:hypothetical protein